MALRDLWGKLTGRASDIPPPSTPEIVPPPEPPAEPTPPAELPPPTPEPVREPPPQEIPPEPVREPEIPNPARAELPVAPVAEPLETAFEAPPAAVPDEAAEEDAPKAGFFARLKAGLSRSTAKLTDAIGSVFLKRKLDDAALEELEEMLIGADLGVAAAGRIVEGFRRTKFGREVTDEEVKTALADEIAAILAPVARPLTIHAGHAPHVVLVVGVNGTGKTTTIAKLAEQYRAQGLKVWMVAGDTFRAAAVEQLQIWGERTGAHVVAPAKMGADAAGLAFDGLKGAKEAGIDVLLVDTAGRLHNKTALMEELRKVVRVLKRGDDAVPHTTLLVLDATTGQNAVSQVKVFKEMVDITGLVVTKLDGSAKGGVVVALAQEFGLPVHAVGVGEKAADMRPFEARDFARSLVGLEG
ncbi:signal recognition particle-docking protein FtsY [Roseococcus sp. XZZS9]|uniref:Signal recognition particle receptor FtsY n=1 Tax=Roseococcus pinisoli TaxID=2835040 RepID=A0ABS5QAY0_9PROT|nr:signal recognition particle-docking protein FtsY [Roseococcus pinisoli]MBS7810859.1 signal recognition particle-docking protein FtsY [Roseococcus pinisoli]